MLHSVDVKDYMIPNPVKVRENADLFDAISLILEHKISGLCVVDENDNLVGVLSEMDCLGAILSASYNEETRVGEVREYMTKEAVVAKAHEDIVDVAADMLKNKHRRRPVVENGKLVGQITCRQLLRAVKEFNSDREQSTVYSAQFGG